MDSVKYRSLSLVARAQLTFKAKLHLKEVAAFRPYKSEIDRMSNTFALAVSDTILKAEKREASEVILTKYMFLGECLQSGREVSITLEYLTSHCFLQAYNKLFPKRAAVGRSAVVLPSGDAEIINDSWAVVFIFHRIV